MSESITRLNSALAGRYVVERELGEGGMASVYLAREIKHDRDVALKVLRPELASVVGPERFLREIRVTARLMHSHILPLLDSGEADGQLFYTMPVATGESLDDRLKRDGQLPIEDAIEIARDVANALGYAHEHGIVHRDIKPANILLEGGRAMVADFGVAGMLEEGAGSKLTWTGMAVGTPMYMSPEQASGTGKVDPRTDIYSLGCILYEMLTGETPFSGASAHSILVKRLTESAPSVALLRDTIPPSLDAAVRKAMHRSPADRFQTAAAFVDALGDAAVEHATGTHAASPLLSALTSVGSASAGSARRGFGKRNIALVVGGLIVAGVGITVVPGMLRRDHSAAVTFSQVTTDPGAEQFPSLSADGSQVAYSRDGDIFIRDVASGSAERRLTQEPQFGNRQPTFSPDGKRVAFRSEREGGGIFLVSVDGDKKLTRLSNLGNNPAWSPDGRSVLIANEGIVDAGTRRGISHLYRVDVESGEQHQLGEGDAVQPSWSPSGKRIAFWSVLREGKLTSQRDIWTMKADGTDPVPVTDDKAVDWGPAWSADGRYLYFTSNRAGSMSLWRVRIDESSGRVQGDLEQVTTPGTASHEHLTTAANGSRMMFAERLTTSNVFKVAFDPQRGQTVGTPIAVTSGTRMAVEPSVSPDGKRLTFWTMSDAMDLYVVGADGSGLRRLTDGKAKYRSPQWSPDGKSIAFHSDRGGNYQIWSADPDVKEFVQLTRSGNVMIYPFWSAKGDRVGFVDLGRGISSVKIASPQGGAEMLIPGDLMVRPAWSPDGSMIAGTLPPAAGGTGINVYSLKDHQMQTISTFGDAPQWLPDGRRLVFVWHNKLFLGDVTTRKVKEILTVDRDQLGLGSVTRDGRWIFFSRAVTEADLWSIEPKR